MKSELNLVPPTSNVSEQMRRVRTSATGPELKVRKIVRALGLRYTSKTKHLPGRPDVLLPTLGIAVFVHGCFWHGCSKCFLEPTTNRLWWRRKIAATRSRDQRTARQLRRLGYSVITIWEHDSDSRIRRRLERSVTIGR